MDKKRSKTITKPLHNGFPVVNLTLLTTTAPSYGHGLPRHSLSIKSPRSQSFHTSCSSLCLRESTFLSLLDTIVINSRWGLVCGMGRSTRGRNKGEEEQSIPCILGWVCCCFKVIRNSLFIIFCSYKQSLKPCHQPPWVRGDSTCRQQMAGEVLL